MSGIASFFRDLLLGMPVVFLGTALISGGIEEAVMVLVLSVVCTFGVGLLLFWIPLCWFVGWLIGKIFVAAMNAA